jgi:hypothetical protein
MADQRLYRFEMWSAFDAGEKRHPERVIREVAPDATNLMPVTIADCWMFRAKEIKNPPPFIVEVKEATHG